MDQLNLFATTAVNYHDGWSIDELNIDSALRCSECLFPHLRSSTSYHYGCRCSDCRSFIEKRRILSATQQARCAYAGCTQLKQRKKGSIYCPAHSWKRCRAEGCENPRRAKQGATYCDEHATMRNGVPGSFICCAICGKQATSTSTARYKEICNNCRTGQRALMRRAVAHKVPVETVVRWAKTPECELCCRRLYFGNSGSEQSFAIDHDHQCCPGTESCGRCIRGLLCQYCNLSLGHYEKLISLAGRDELINYLAGRKLPR